MRYGFIDWVRGHVRVQIRGRQTEKLLNRAATGRLSVWDVRRTGSELMELNLPVNHYFRLRPFLKETGCRVHVVARFGLPFVLDKLEKRKFFAVGFCLFLLLFLMFSSLVWQVKIEGNERITDEAIMKAARQSGVFPLQWKFRLGSNDRIARSMLQKLPDASWVGVDVRGTHVTIKVVEAKEAEKRPLMNPRHLVASTDAVITQIFTERGRPMVRKNMRVRKGDVLISGILGDEENSQVVVAEGTVRGLVWREFDIAVPLVQKYRTFTGEAKKKKYIVAGSRGLLVWGFGKAPYAKSETESRSHMLKLGRFQLPIGWMEDRVMEVKFEQRPLSEEEAKRLGIERAIAEISTQSGGKATVVAQNILHEKKEFGKVYMKVLFEVDEIISKEQAIIP